MLFPASRRTLVTALSLALCAAPIAVYAQASYQFNLPMQSLADSLRAVGSQTSTDIAFEPATVQGRSASTLKGSYSVREALDRLLIGSGLKVRTTQGGSFLIESGGSNNPPPMPPKSTTYTFHLPAQSLALTLQAIERSTGQRIKGAAGLIASKGAAAISGRMTSLRAVQKALVGTGLRVDTSAEGMMTIRAVNEQVAPGDVENMDEVVVTGKVEGLSAMRVPTELREIPQTVSVISQDTLQQQNAVALSDAFNWATGITLTQTSTGQSQFYSRGFEIGEIHIDGGAPIITNNGGANIDDLSEYDRVEVLRGADGLFGGAGTPGGTVNLVRKQPSAQDAASVTATAGSSDFYRLVFDATGALNSEGSLRGRVVASSTDQDYFYDMARHEEHKIYGILAYDLTPQTTLSVGGSVEQSISNGSYTGLPRFDNGDDPHLPRSTALMFPWNHDTANTSEAFAQLDQSFNDNWKLKIGATMIDENSSGLDGQSVSSAINPVTHLINAPPVAISSSTSAYTMTMDATLTGAFDWNGRKQEVLIGMDSSRVNLTDDVSSVSVIGPPLDPWVFDPAAYPVPIVGPTNPGVFTTLDGFTKAVGGYASVRLRPLEWVAINPGLVLGPVLDKDSSASVLIVAKLLRGEIPGLPRLGYPIVDVRDLADLEVRAMTSPQAAGQRYIAAGSFASMAEIAHVLKERLGDKANKVPTRKLPDWVVRFVGLFDREVRGQLFELGKVRRLSSAKAEKDFGWSSRPWEETIVDTATSLEAVGALS
jgi:outer membrane receptor for ferric coprogen and ferric-rhodotorulic acid